MPTKRLVEEVVPSADFGSQQAAGFSAFEERGRLARQDAVADEPCFHQPVGHDAHERAPAHVDQEDATDQHCAFG